MKDEAEPLTVHLSSFIFHPSSLIPHPSSFILYGPGTSRTLTGDIEDDFWQPAAGGLKDAMEESDERERGVDFRGEPGEDGDCGSTGSWCGAIVRGKVGGAISC